MSKWNFLVLLIFVFVFTLSIDIYAAIYTTTCGAFGTCDFGLGYPFPVSCTITCYNSRAYCQGGPEGVICGCDNGWEIRIDCPSLPGPID